LFIIVSPFDCGARLFGANPEVRRLQRRCERRSAPPRAHFRPSSSEALIAAPGESNSRVRFIARRFVEGTQAFAGTNQKKMSLKLARVQKKAANSRKFAAILPARPPSGHRKRASAVQGQSAVSAR
jgi:hypothetical protein